MLPGSMSAIMAGMPAQHVPSNNCNQIPTHKRGCGWQFEMIDIGWLVGGRDASLHACDRWPWLTGKAPGRSDRIIARFACDLFNWILSTSIMTLQCANHSLLMFLRQTRTHQPILVVFAVEVFILRPNMSICYVLSRLHIKTHILIRKVHISKKQLHFCEFKIFC